MNPDLEALILSLDAVLQARTGEEAERCEATYQARIDDVLSRRPGLSRERLMLAVDYAHAQWLRSQKKPSALPPKA